MSPRRSLLDTLTLLLYLATAAVVVLVAAIFLNPALVPATLRPPAEAPPSTALALVTPEVIPTATPPVVFPTLPPEWTPTPSPEFTPTATPDLYPTFTPSGGPQPTLLPNLNSTAEAGVDGRVVADAGFLRVRALAGTAGAIIGNLSPNTGVQIIGRSTESDWLEIIGPDELRGWVMAPFLEVYINLLSVPITAGAVLDATATQVIPDEAQVAEDGNNLRLRAFPGTAGTIIGNLPAGMILDLVGRTADNVWLQIITSDNRPGWVMTQYVDVYMDLATLPVTGEPVNATGTPPVAAPAAGQPANTPVSVAFVPSATPWPSATVPPPTIVPPTHTPLPTATPLPPPPTATNPPPPPPPSELIFGISQHARDIYLAGQSLGNRANVFAKIGDSITVSPQFLAPIGYGQYNLREYAGLAEVVNFFGAGWARTGNAFVNTSLAAKGGWSTFSLVAGSTADRNYCRAFESPLQCEIRLTRPALALILIGTNDVLSSSNEGYQANLRRIVADCISQGVIPVLSTLPPFLRAGYEGRVGEFNAIIIGVAQEYDIPVWNYWAALQGLPNQGMGSDGIHPAWAPNAADFTLENLQYGSTMRNLTALQVLDALWRQVMY